MGVHPPGVKLHLEVKAHISFFLSDDCREWFGGFRQTWKCLSEFLDCVCKLRIIDFVGPFAGIFRGMIEFLLTVSVSSVTTEVISNREVGVIRVALFTQPGDRGAIPFGRPDFLREEPRSAHRDTQVGRCRLVLQAWGKCPAGKRTVD